MSGADSEWAKNLIILAVAEYENQSKYYPFPRLRIILSGMPAIRAKKGRIFSLT